MPREIWCLWHVFLLHVNTLLADSAGVASIPAPCSIWHTDNTFVDEFDVDEKGPLTQYNPWHILYTQRFVQSKTMNLSRYYRWQVVRNNVSAIWCDEDMFMSKAMMLLLKLDHKALNEDLHIGSKCLKRNVITIRFNKGLTKGAYTTICGSCQRWNKHISKQKKDTATPCTDSRATKHVSPAPFHLQKCCYIATESSFLQLRTNRGQ